MAKSRWIGIYHFRHRNKEGVVIWEDKCENFLADEGEYAMLDQFLRGAAQYANTYLGLVNDTPAETDALTDLQNEPSGNGYSRVTISSDNTGWPTIELDSGDYQVVSKTCTFTADGGTIGPVTYAFLASSSDNTGKLIAAVALSTTRTLADGESLDVDITVKLGEVA